MKKFGSAKERTQSRLREDLAAGKEVRRDDIDPETFAKRLREFRDFTLPMIYQLETEKRLIIIDAEFSVDEVTAETRRVLGGFFG